MQLAADLPKSFLELLSACHCLGSGIAYSLMILSGAASQVPVAEGSPTPLSGIGKARTADFVHGTDGFGNTSQEAVQVWWSSLLCERSKKDAD